MKFVNLSAEAYIDTPSSSWQKHKIAVISVKNSDFLSIFVVILPAVIIVDESLNNNKKAFKSIKPCAFSHFFDTLKQPEPRLFFYANDAAFMRSFAKQ